MKQKDRTTASDEQINEWANHFKKYVKWEKILAILEGDEVIR